MNIPKTWSLWEHVNSGTVYLITSLSNVQAEPTRLDRHPTITVFYEGIDGKKWNRTLNSFMHWFRERT